MTDRKRTWPRTAVVAAAMALALTGTVLAAGVVSGFDIVQIFNGEKTITWGGEEKDLLFEVTDDGMSYFPVEELPQEVRDAAAQNNGGLVYLDKGSWSAAAEWLGLELPNSAVLEQKSAVPVGLWTRNEDGSEEHYDCRVILDGRKLGSINVETTYLLNNKVNVWVMARVKTDGIQPEYRGNPWYGVLTSGDTTAEKEEYLTANGLETVIVTTDGGEEGLLTTEAFFTLNGIGYRLATYHQDAEESLAVLKEVLDGFQ